MQTKRMPSYLFHWATGLKGSNNYAKPQVNNSSMLIKENDLRYKRPSNKILVQ